MKIQKHLFLRWKLIMLLWFLCLSLQHAVCSQGEECSCEVIVREACTYKTIGKITGKSFEQKRPFSLFYTPSKDAEKVVAAWFVWTNSYHCDAAKGYICDEEVINNTFAVSVSKAENLLTDQACLAGIFTFSAEGEDGIVCKPTQNETPVSHQDHTELPEKGSVRPEYDKAFLERTSENSNEAKSNFGWMGPVAGAVFGIAGVALLFFYLRRNNTSPEFTDLETAPVQEDKREVDIHLLSSLEPNQTTTVNGETDLHPLQTHKNHI